MDKYKVRKDSTAYDFLLYVNGLYETVNHQLYTKAKDKFISENIKPIATEYLNSLANHPKTFIKPDPEQQVTLYFSRYSYVYIDGFACPEHSELKYPYADLADKWTEFKSPTVKLNKPVMLERIGREVLRCRRTLATTILLNFPELKIFAELQPGVKLPKPTSSNYWRHKVLDRSIYSKEQELSDKENLQTLATLIYL